MNLLSGSKKLSSVFIIDFGRAKDADEEEMSIDVYDLGWIVYLLIPEVEYRPAIVERMVDEDPLKRPSLQDVKNMLELMMFALF